MREAVLTQLTAPGGGSPLRVASVAKRDGVDVIEAVALSSGQGLYPIRDGILDLLPDDVGPLSPAQASNQWEVVARFYERPWRIRSLTVFSGEPLPFERERRIFDQMLGDVRGTLWLDLAASTALYGRWLAPRLVGQQGEVVSLDFAWPMLRQARRFVQAEGHSNLSLVRARGEALPFASGTLDGVVCGGSLNEFGPRSVKKVLSEVGRALRPGGIGFFMHLLRAERGAGRLFQRYVAQPGGIGFWSRTETGQLFQQAGLQVEAQHDFGVVGFTRVVRTKE